MSLLNCIYKKVYMHCLQLLKQSKYSLFWTSISIWDVYPPKKWSTSTRGIWIHIIHLSNQSLQRTSLHKAIYANNLVQITSCILNSMIFGTKESSPFHRHFRIRYSTLATLISFSVLRFWIRTLLFCRYFIISTNIFKRR